MKKGDTIKIESLLQKEISSIVVIHGKKYLILTENYDPKEQVITTRVYLGGKIISTRTVDVGNILKTPGFEKKITELIQTQHKMITNTLKDENAKKSLTPSAYLDEVKRLLQKKNNRSALNLLTQGIKNFPDDPFLLSYYGCLDSIINKNYAYGIDTCSRALEILNERIPFGKEIFFPTFYLNLGRAYLASGRKKDAVTAFRRGLSYEPENKDLLWEVKKLGMRKNPPIPYLKRSNPLNKYIGMVLHTLKKTPSLGRVS
jgi:tetratricopeptide (TPR) repeat protein